MQFCREKMLTLDSTFTQRSLKGEKVDFWATLPPLKIPRPSLTSLSAVPWLSPLMLLLLVLPLVSRVRGGFQVRSPVARL